MPAALISTRTSPAFGPSSCTVSILRGSPALWATAARVSIYDLLPKFNALTIVRRLLTFLSRLPQRGDALILMVGAATIGKAMPSFAWGLGIGKILGRDL